MVRRDDTWCSHVEVVAHDVLESLRIAFELERELAQRQLRPERLPGISAWRAEEQEEVECETLGSAMDLLYNSW